MWEAITDVIAGQMRDTFGTPITLQSKYGPPQELRGIYEQVTTYDDLTGQSSLMGEDAYIEFRARDLTFLPDKNDMIIVKKNGKRYKIIKPEFDGHAIHRFYLKEFV